MVLTINGESKEVDDGLNIEEVLKILNLPNERVAVELNLSVIRKAEWSVTKLRDGDKLEIIHFVGGG